MHNLHNLHNSLEYSQLLLKTFVLLFQYAPNNDCCVKKILMEIRAKNVTSLSHSLGSSLFQDSLFCKMQRCFQDDSCTQRYSRHSQVAASGLLASYPSPQNWHRALGQESRAILKEEN